MTPASSDLNIVDLVRNGTHYTEVHGDLLHVIEVKTGKRLIVARNAERRTPRELVPLQMPDGSEAYIEAGIAAPRALSFSVTTYSPVILDRICALLAEGDKGITEICKMDGMPTYQTLNKWRREFPEIDLALAKAREDRAEASRDKAFTLASEIDDENFNQKKTQIELHKWSAGVDNPKFSPKAKVEATINTPTQIIVQTGIDRGERDVGNGK